MLHKMIVSTCLLFSLCLAGSSFGVSVITPAPSGRGTLLNFEQLRTYSKTQLDAEFSSKGLQALYGITLYRVSFQTEAPHAEHQAIKASGLIIVPDSQASTYPWISLQHGTILPKGSAPTLKPSEGRYEASQGFVTLVADYLGYGDSGGLLHPYLMAKSYTTSGVDFLRAAQSFAEQSHLVLGPLFLQGYSEGGYATLALQKALETQYAGEFPLRASAPNAGPYDMEDLALKGLAAKENNPLSTAFIILSLADWGGFDVNLNRVFNYDVKTLRELLAADQPDAEAIKALPTETRTFMNTDFIDDFIAEVPQSYEGSLARQLFAEQSLNRGSWTPSIPTRFHHCVDDEVVAVDQTRNIVKHMQTLNPSAPISAAILASPEPNKPYNHVTCPLIYEPAAWFKEMILSGAVR
ncbi:MAG: hypothetical protein NTX25_14495 [Proteobacteria bacterium]|nr:hypothetical protein [Pseudomonadota bacterium]